MTDTETTALSTAMPQDPIAAAVALGVPSVRIEILRFLRTQPATVSQIAHAVGRTRYGMQNHLDVLEELGTITHRTEKVRGVFRPARLYRLSPAGTEALAWCLFDSIADDSAQADR